MAHEGPIPFPPAARSRKKHLVTAALAGLIVAGLLVILLNSESGRALPDTSYSYQQAVARRRSSSSPSGSWLFFSPFLFFVRLFLSPSTSPAASVVAPCKNISSEGSSQSLLSQPHPVTVTTVEQKQLHSPLKGEAADISIKLVNATSSDVKAPYDTEHQKHTTKTLAKNQLPPQQVATQTNSEQLLQEKATMERPIVHLQQQGGNSSSSSSSPQRKQGSRRGGASTTSSSTGYDTGGRADGGGRGGDAGDRSQRRWLSWSDESSNTAEHWKSKFCVSSEAISEFQADQWEAARKEIAMFEKQLNNRAAHTMDIEDIFAASSAGRGPPLLRPPPFSGGQQQLPVPVQGESWQSWTHKAIIPASSSLAAATAVLETRSGGSPPKRLQFYEQTYYVLTFPPRIDEHGYITPDPFPGFKGLSADAGTGTGSSPYSSCSSTNTAENLVPRNPCAKRPFAPDITPTISSDAPPPSPSQGGGDSSSHFHHHGGGSHSDPHHPREEGLRGNSQWDFLPGAINEECRHYRPSSRRLPLTYKLKSFFACSNGTELSSSSSSSSVFSSMLKIGDPSATTSATSSRRGSSPPVNTLAFFTIYKAGNTYIRSLLEHSLLDNKAGYSADVMIKTLMKNTLNPTIIRGTTAPIHSHRSAPSFSRPPGSGPGPGSPGIDTYHPAPPSPTFRTSPHSRSPRAAAGRPTRPNFSSQEGYYPFAFVRDPIERFISGYTEVEYRIVNSPATPASCGEGPRSLLNVEHVFVSMTNGTLTTQPAVLRNQRQDAQARPQGEQQTSTQQQEQEKETRMRRMKEEAKEEMLKERVAEINAMIAKRKEAAALSRGSESAAVEILNKQMRRNQNLRGSANNNAVVAYHKRVGTTATPSRETRNTGNSTGNTDNTGDRRKLLAAANRKADGGVKNMEPKEPVIIGTPHYYEGHTHFWRDYPLGSTARLEAYIIWILKFAASNSIISKCPVNDHIAPQVGTLVAAAQLQSSLRIFHLENFDEEWSSLVREASLSSSVLSAKESFAQQRDYHESRQSSYDLYNTTRVARRHLLKGEKRYGKSGSAKARSSISSSASAVLSEAFSLLGVGTGGGAGSSGGGGRSSYTRGERFLRALCRIYASDFVCLGYKFPSVCLDIQKEFDDYIEAKVTDFGKLSTVQRMAFDDGSSEEWVLQKYPTNYAIQRTIQKSVLVQQRGTIRNSQNIGIYHPPPPSKPLQ